MIVAYPMVEEDEATGRVAAVYAAALEQSPFVPSLLKSLAVCPPYAVLAWEQGAAVLASADAAETVERLAASVTDAAAPPADPRDRRLLAGFVEPLGRMLLLSCGLLAGLEGALPGRPSARGAAPPPPSQPLRPGVAPTGALAAHADVLGRIRAALDTPIVNSVWRRAAEEGRLEALWDQLEPQAAPTRARAGALHDAAAAAAADLPWEVVADPASLRAAGVEDAAPAMRSMLRAYAVTLPRVLVLVASSWRSPSR